MIRTPAETIGDISRSENSKLFSTPGMTQTRHFLEQREPVQRRQRWGICSFQTPSPAIVLILTIPSLAARATTSARRERDLFACNPRPFESASMSACKETLQSLLDEVAGSSGEEYFSGSDSAATWLKEGSLESVDASRSKVNGKSLYEAQEDFPPSLQKYDVHRQSLSWGPPIS